MKLTPQLKEEIKQVMDDYWETYLRGDLEGYAAFLPPDFKVIGTVKEEIWESKDEFLAYTERLLSQMVGRAEMRNKQVHLYLMEPNVMVHEFGDMYIKTNEEWELYSEFRISSLLKKIDGAWKVMHQHGSYPDSRTQQGEAFAFDKIVAENKKLQEAVLKRTRELEQKNRELEIEASLERIRARAMAMHHPDELSEVLSVVFEQFDVLGINPIHSTLSIFDEQANTAIFRMTGRAGKRFLAEQKIDLDAMDEWKETVERWKKSEPNSIHSPYYPKELLPKVWDVFEEILSKLPEESRIYQEDFPDGMYFCEGNCKFGYIGFCHTRKPTEEEKVIVLKFATEFGSLYQRFLDLLSLQAQAREAQIEVALERVRAKTMAMRNGNELADTAMLLFDQLLSLEFKPRCCGFLVMNDETRAMEDWSANIDEHGKGALVTGTLAYDQHPLLEQVVATWHKGDPYIVTGIDDAEELQAYYRAVTSLETTSSEIQDKVLSVATSEWTNSFNFEYGMMYVLTPDPISKDEISVMLRFAGVFKGTYRRFLDLQNAEAQAREAQIETALERVRSRAMAMQHSNELADLVSKVFQEMTHLDIMLTRCIIWIFDPEDRSARLWMANQEAATGAENYFLPHHDHPTYQAFLKAWQDRESKWVYDLHGNLKTTWDELLFNETEFARLPDEVKAGMKAPDRISLSATFNNFGALQTAGLEPLSDEYLDILNRFGRVFDLTYTRFHDLQQAEKQAKQAQAEAALERVRARALAMQEPEELTEVASVLWQEMGMLGVEELETSSIYINDESIDKAECWYALKDIREETSTLVSDHFELDLNDTWVGREMLKFYTTGENQVSIVMTGDNRKEWIRYCEERSPVIRGYYGEVIPDRTYHLYKFSHGAVAAAAAGDISEGSWDLLQRTASVFSLAYSRFKDLTQARLDLQHLMEEKSRAEEALTELKSTQAQLIHAEKMASLGELTAGIAHEIQNPLNFVNNFSEVSQELLEEMETELKAGNTGEVEELARDVVQNLEKITTHGRRADAIVKSMLQHSRTTAGTKEPTDLNELVDEFLRLSYHGLRAKNKSFNADFHTNLDDSLPKVEVIAQDLGRVLLNLINNAFYACTERSRSARTERGRITVTEKNLIADNYKPTVTASTINLGDKIEIRVKDNGNGIPQDALDKIFQPFFTTKPTGQGTGLGLSLSYDIIRAHGGELKVESENGIGTEMIIELPIKLESRE